jgi:hypothetical protein
MDLVEILRQYANAHRYDEDRMVIGEMDRINAAKTMDEYIATKRVGAEYRLVKGMRRVVWAYVVSDNAIRLHPDA